MQANKKTEGEKKKQNLISVLKSV